MLKKAINHTDNLHKNRIPIGYRKKPNKITLKSFGFNSDSAHSLNQGSFGTRDQIWLC